MLQMLSLQLYANSKQIYLIISVLLFVVRSSKTFCLFSVFVKSNMLLACTQLQVLAKIPFECSCFS